MLTFISFNFGICFRVSYFPIVTAWGHYKVSEEEERQRYSRQLSPKGGKKVTFSFLSAYEEKP